MRTRDFSFNLPEELIAQFPSEKRGESRLLVLDRADGSLRHAMLRDLPGFLPPRCLMVFNDSRVRKSRLYGLAETGGRVEFLFTKRLSAAGWEAVVSKARKQREGKRFLFAPGSADEVGVTIRGGEGETRTVDFDREIDEAWFERNGHIPLPPYIKRDDAPQDASRYQTVYARENGSSAAPTAGLHFTDGLLAELDRQGFERAFVTLHVGLGTFLPVRVEELEGHKMHEEAFEVPADTAGAVARARSEGRKVLAVGTTSVRSLESAWDGKAFREGPSSTGIFIYPGYRFGVVDALFTNFHTPESTLLMLVSAFAGRERILAAYEEAVRERYRFFSYGDAMLIL